MFVVETPLINCNFRYLRNVTIQQSDGKPDIAFSSDGTLKSVELKIMNLRPDGRSNQDLIWEEVRKC